MKTKNKTFGNVLVMFETEEQSETHKIYIKHGCGGNQ